MDDVFLHEGVVHGVQRCPQCGVAKPLISLVSKADKHFDGHEYSFWHFSGRCSKCLRHVLFYGKETKGGDGSFLEIGKMWPSLCSASDDLPAPARRFLQQAIESKHAPDGAIMLAASAVDAMLKAKNYRTGTLYSRIEKAAEQHVLTEQMREWAHEIRLDSNDPRHADEGFRGFQEEDVDRVIDFARAIGEYLFVLPARVQRWRKDAT